MSNSNSQGRISLILPAVVTSIWVRGASNSVRALTLVAWVVGISVCFPIYLTAFIGNCISNLSPCLVGVQISQQEVPRSAGSLQHPGTVSLLTHQGQEQSKRKQIFSPYSSMHEVGCSSERTSSEQVMECFLQPKSTLANLPVKIQKARTKVTHTHTHTQETLNQGLGAEALESGRSSFRFSSCTIRGPLGELLYYFHFHFLSVKQR